ncbi:TRAP transporter large permease [Sphaerotilus mobilis]|uniref:TRAP transporter large permease protein n=1 Tax=Sphaerotilus mobilis TaxID=47994 RepID=A0A4Q7LID0_9BURK|nr:TRAP transporter large permease [Sphaerotilus mobilis]RZS53238.1 tripartite ATP-independent transporter DctM subunit [Sphaerotilus mobilis]
MNLALLALGGVLVAGMLMRLPIGFAMIASGVAYLTVKQQDLGLVAEQIGNGLYNSYVLLAVPMFVLAANLMNAGTVSERLFDFCRILVGRMRGGLAQVDILVSVIFSGMSGSAIADAAGPGLVTIKQMLRKPEYSRGFAGAVVVASATLGPIIPPSIPMVIYGLVSGASVGALFLGGVLPGLLMALSMMVVVHIIAVRRNMPREAPVPWSEWPTVIFRGALPLSMPVVLLGGIYSGAFTPTEAAAVAALHALILSTLVYRALSLRRLAGVVLESARSSAVITLILAGSFMLNYAFTAEGVPQAMAQWVDAMDLGRVPFLLLVNLMFLVLGCFLDVSVLLLVFVPMLLPAVNALGIDLVHFGVLVVLNMMIGMVHPPFGMLLFVTKALTGIPIGEMMKEGWPFIVMLLMLLLALTLFPQLVLWLPQTMGYGVK